MDKYYEQLEIRHSLLSDGSIMSIGALHTEEVQFLMEITTKTVDQGISIIKESLRNVMEALNEET